MLKIRSRVLLIFGFFAVAVVLSLLWATLWKSDKHFVETAANDAGGCSCTYLWSDSGEKVLDGPYRKWIGSQLVTKGIFRFGLPEGLWETWHRDGPKSSEHTYVDGKLHGWAHLWTPDHRARYDQYYSNGVQQGPEVQVLVRNGNILSSKTYVNGVVEGLRLTWFENGTLELRQEMLHGKGHGQHTQWYESGALKAECAFKNGKPSGIWKEYDRDGQCTRETRYDEE